MIIPPPTPVPSVNMMASVYWLADPAKTSHSAIGVVGYISAAMRYASLNSRRWDILPSETIGMYQKVRLWIYVTGHADAPRRDVFHLQACFENRFFADFRHVGGDLPRSCVRLVSVYSPLR